MTGFFISNFFYMHLNHSLANLFSYYKSTHQLDDLATTSHMTNNLDETNKLF